MNTKQCLTDLPELIINQPNGIEKEKFYNSIETQTIFIEDNNKKDEQIDDDIEIIPTNILQDDFNQSFQISTYNTKNPLSIHFFKLDCLLG